MAKPYSYDFRQKVIEAIEMDGLKKSEASELFHISRNTAACLRGKLPPQNCLIDLWLKRQAETGDFQAKPHQPLGNNHKITDWEKFGKFAKAHRDKTQEQMAELWQGDISAREILRALKKIGFTRKKDLWVSRTR